MFKLCREIDEYAVVQDEEGTLDIQKNCEDQTMTQVQFFQRRNGVEMLINNIHPLFWLTCWHE